MVSRAAKLKIIRKRAAAEAEGRILGQYKAHSKKPLLESLKEHFGHIIDNVDYMDFITLFGIYVKYNTLDNFSPIASLIQATLDLALLKSRTEAGTVAVLLHLGLTEIPNIANLLDKLTGGPGTVWEDFLSVVTSFQFGRPIGKPYLPH